MFLIDDIALAPLHGLFWILREIRNAALQERAGEAESITLALTELYMMLETGQIAEAEFDAREGVLLDRLDALRGGRATADENGLNEDGQVSEESG